MKQLLERAVYVSLVPLGLALAALGVREATRETFRSPPSAGRASEFTPPPLFLAASAARGVAQTARVDGARSSARVLALRGASADPEQGLRAEGTLRILADETLADLELDLTPLADASVNGWPRDMSVHLREVSARSHATAVPGVRACTLRCTVSVGGTSRAASLAANWLRLPGGALELHAFASLDWAPFDLPAPRRWGILPADPHYALGIDLVLRAEE